MLGFLAFCWWTSAVSGNSRGGRTPPELLEKQLDEFVEHTVTAFHAGLKGCPMVESLLKEDTAPKQ